MFPRAIVLVTLFLGFFLSDQAFANTENKVVLHINHPAKVDYLLNNINNLKNIYGDDIKIAAVFNGPAVTRLLSTDPIASEIRQVLKMGVKIEMCPYAMLKQSVRIDLVTRGVKVIEQGGTAKLIELQQAGYAYIKI